MEANARGLLTGYDTLRRMRQRALISKTVWKLKREGSHSILSQRKQMKFRAGAKLIASEFTNFSSVFEQDVKVILFKSKGSNQKV